MTQASAGSDDTRPAFPPDDLLKAIETVVVEAAEKAGAYVRSRFGGELKVERKDDARGSLVTDADRESQQLIAAIISDRFPDHLLIGEEDPPDEAPQAPDFAWAVDPVDGTTNFVNGLPIYAVSIAVLHRGRPVAGACYLPWPTDGGHVMLHARKGGGAWLDGRRLSVRGPSDGTAPEKGRISLVPGGMAGPYKIGGPLLRAFGEPRTTGSLVYELALVATGVSQYIVSGFASIWDHAAGMLLVTEAGGKVVSLRTGEDGRLRSGWAPLETFDEHYANSPDTFRRLRAWHRPVIAGSPGVVDFLAKNLTLRRPSLLRRVRRVFRRKPQ